MGTWSNSQALFSLCLSITGSLEKTTLFTPNRDLNLDLLVIDSLVYCERRWWRSIPTRYMFAAEACFTILLMTYNSAGVPIAVTAMIYKVTVIGGNDNDTDVCHQPVVNETFISKPGEFEWDGMTRTTVIAAGEIGMLLSYLVSARICEIFGTRYIVGFSFLINGGVACLQPTFIRLNVWLYVCVTTWKRLLSLTHLDSETALALLCPMGRVKEHVLDHAAKALGAEGSVVPGFNILFTRWLVGKERMIVAALVFSVSLLGDDRTNRSDPSGEGLKLPPGG
uniref:Uncharacterized protein n=1 Tax=Timema cristinae TaxID=61476 RepID=A0A7R9D7K8_TIMCR|nr:unnamed protein product [Timema cristinae]